ncbi:phosphotransferase family protein [Nocardiopsis changdeensis]|uniref:phosphotransferase family protein n=1 Tax=Nocardiopsis changdeensis TaxID=2831969 RepID=UPI003F47A772
METIAAAVAARHGIPPAGVRPLPAGAANHVLALGESLVLRVPRGPDHEADLRKEAALIPVVRAAGVPTPELVEYREGEPPTMLLERLPGTDLVGRAPGRDVLLDLGRRLAALHAVPADALPGLPRETGDPDPAALVGRVHAAGYIDADTAGLLRAWCAGLAPLVPAAAASAPVHGDIAPQNLIVTPEGALAGIVDWGDAAVADPATDFAKLPPAWLPAVLEGYGVPGMEARVLWHHLAWALGRLLRPDPVLGRRHWTAPPLSRILALLLFFASGPPDPWPRLGPGALPSAPAAG